MSEILIASTIAPYKVDPEQPLITEAWFEHADQLRLDAGFHGHSVHYFSVLETDGRGIGIYNTFLDKLRDVDGYFWRFTLDTNEAEYDTHTRIKRICTGRNLITERAMDSLAEWILFLDTDMEPDPVTFSKLLEMEWPIVCGDVPTYCSRGAPVTEKPPWPDLPLDRWVKTGVTRECFGEPKAYDFPVEFATHYCTAGYALVHRSVFKHLRWRWAMEDQMSDDPCYWQDAERLGFPPLQRKDCVGTHHPYNITEIESRIPQEVRRWQPVNDAS